MTAGPFLNDASRELLVSGAGSLGVELSPSGVERFDTYIGLLQKWGKKMNLSTRLETDEIVVYHFLDSLATCRAIARGGEGTLVDIGAGAGFPALPLKIALPRLEVSLIDSSNKKLSFCREVVRRLDLTEVEIVQGRGEELARLPAWRGRFDWAVARAFGAAVKTARICLPFLGERGTLILYKGKVQEEELLPLREEADRIGAAVEVEEIQVPSLDASRSLVFVTKRST
jgi:16S rRNA (guanine527-N7)-methyltransferase